MALPAQVEQDLKDIAELEKQFAAQPDSGDTPDEDEAETEQIAEAPQVVEDESPPAEEKPDSQVEAKEDFEHKYKTLRGKYDAEVPRLHSQVKALMEEVGDLKAAQEAAEEKPEKPPEPTTYVTDADRENFGEDLLDVQRRVAQEVSSSYEAKITQLEGVIDTLTKRIDGTNNSVSELTFEQRLGRLVPDFDAINNDPKWISWLDEVDPIIRGPRRNVAQRAFVEGDAEAVADYVRLFKSSQKPVQTQQTPREVELEKQVTPSRTTTPSNTTTATDNRQRTYTKAQTDQVWSRIDVLNKAGKYDEANKLEAEISVAMLEGRAEL
jgi:hypothetical protein